MAKQMIFDDNARQALARGAKKLADAVAVTMGPKGRNVVINKKFGAPQITKDGVTVAREIELEDSYENMGAQLVKEASSKTNENAGDGTTTATVLAYSIIEEGLRNVAAGASPIGLRRGIEAGVEKIIEELERVKKDVTTEEEIAQVGTISSQDEKIGGLIAEAMSKVGKDGVITVDESNTMGLYVDVAEGMQFDNGFISPYMVTDQSRMEASYDDVSMLITDKKISSIQDILPLLEQLAGQGRKDLVILAEDVEGEALATMVLNKLHGRLNILAVKAPAFGDRRKEMLKDIAALTGATVISSELGLELKNATIEHLGEAKKVVSNKEHTTIVEGKGRKEDIDARVNAIKSELSTTTSDFDKEKLQERLAKLQGGVAIIKVGAATEVELKEKKDRIEDALNATSAAVRKGIVPGGGVALLQASKVLSGNDGSTDEETGMRILMRALAAPAHRIADNAGFDGSVVVHKIKEAGEGHGLNAATGEYVNMLEDGVVDPLAVTEDALRNAASIAAAVLTAECLVTDLPEKDEPAMPGGGMPGGMPGMM